LRGYDLSLTDAVKQGLVTEAQIDSSLAILLRTRFKLGISILPAATHTIGYPNPLSTAGHRALARKVAEKSIVLLKNDECCHCPIG